VFAKMWLGRQGSNLGMAGSKLLAEAKNQQLID
jgi:hypothetical protein